MRIAFYAPLKPPSHPVPSGDRLMARLLIAALERKGQRVEVASGLRSYLSEPSPDAMAERDLAAAREIERIAAAWRQAGPPDLWFCYHPYYKAPDLIGPSLARLFDVPYATAEASYSARRVDGPWGGSQQMVIEAVRGAAVNICLTRRDRDGLAEIAPQARYAMLAPFIDTAAFASGPAADSGRLVAIAMMRKGDKLDSYRMLAEALALIGDLPWSLSAIGDGPLRHEVHALFAGFGSRVDWLGQMEAEDIARELAKGGILTWPGCGEAYGLAYLEAQAAGLAVVAQDTAGVPEVVRHDETGLLARPGDVAAYAAAIRRLLGDGGKRRRMAAAARRFVLGERSLDRAASRLKEILAR